jgi:trk system potassium uptake protein TrkH
MYIGGAPASMAGGGSTSTVAVLFFAVLAFAQGHNAAVAFERTLPTETIAKAVAIMTVGTVVCAIVTLVLSARLGYPIFVTAFEVISAFSNTGYSLGLTPDLDTFSRYLIAFTMFWGRLGPLTIVVALAKSAQPVLVRHPAEPVILG